MKFNPQSVGNQHTLAVALSDGSLSLLPLDLSTTDSTVWKGEERVLIQDDSTICLSVDWSNQMVPSTNPSLVVSLSDGQLSCCSVRDGSLSVVERWRAHTLPSTTIPAEVWIASFDPLDATSIFSGGDDGVMKQWDTRLVGATATPVAVSRVFEAGVTSMCWNKMDSLYLTVGSYDGHVRIFDKRQIRQAVSDLDIQNNAGIWRIKYKHNSNYFVDQSSSATKNEFLIAAMRAGFQVLDYDEQHRMNQRAVYLKQGTESLAYGVDYICKKGCALDAKEGFVGSCSFYNHLMHVWRFSY